MTSSALTPSHWQALEELQLELFFQSALDRWTPVDHVFCREGSGTSAAPSRCNTVQLHQRPRTGLPPVQLSLNCLDTVKRKI